MRRIALAAILLSLIFLGAYTASAESPDVPKEIEDVDEIVESSTSDAVRQSTPGNIEVVIEANSEVGDAEMEKLESMGADASSRYASLVQAEIEPDRRSQYGSLPWVTDIREPRIPVPKVGGEGAEVIGAQRAHDAGVTGENVSVAVVDLGFNPDNSRISDNVVEYKAFGTSDIAGTSPSHGTSSAEVVLDVAPDADLYLATIGTDVGYANALEWAEKKDVDVITASLGFFGQPNDGTGFVSQVSDETVDATDAVFAASTGNSGESHWEGEFKDSDGDNLHDFQADYEVNYLNADSGTLSSDNRIPAGARIQVYLTWDDWDSADSNYNLALVRSDGNGGVTEVRAKETDVRGSQPYKRLTYTTSSEAYYGVVVQKTAGDSDEIELFTRTAPDRLSSLMYTVSQGSIVPPAVAEGTLGTGAFNYNKDTVAPYSSRGPTNDGRQGVTLLAPDCATTSAYGDSNYCGTSGASPHAAGVAALLRSAATLDNTEVENLMTQTADPMTGGSYAVGAGALNASAAVGTVLEGDTQSSQPQVLSIDHPDAVQPNGSFDVTVNTSSTAKSAVEVSTSGFEVDLSVIDDDGDNAFRDSPNRTEFTDPYADGGTYVVDVDITNASGGETGEIAAYAGGRANETDNEDVRTSLFAVEDPGSDGNVTSSPVTGVSDELWMAVTGDGTLSLGDLGTAIQGYQANGEVNGVELPDRELLEAAMTTSSTSSTEGGARAAMGEESSQSEEVVRVLEFSLGDEYYCLDIEYVEEIVKRDAVTRVPNTPAFVDGVVDLRGQITTILEPKAMMNIESEGEQNLIVVFDPAQFEEQGAVGWVVDEVRQVVPVTESEINNPPVDADYINGVIDRDDHEQFVIWIEPEDALTQATTTDD